MHPEIVQLRAILQRLYVRHRGEVAFIDESYRDGATQGEFPFYTLTAVLISIEDLEQLRASHAKAAGGSWWHTTEMFQNREFRAIRSFLETLVQQDTRALISVQVKVLNDDLELARRECLIQTAAHLEKRGCELLVYERREDMRSRNADDSLFTRAKAAGLISRNLKTIAAHPAAENLLWGPDLVGWAVRRHIAVKDSRWLKIILNQVEIIDASPELSLSAKGPEPAAAKGSGPDFSVDQKGERKNRSSSPIMTRGKENQKSIFDIFSKAAKPVHSPDELSAWIKTNFPVSRKQHP
jgi:hypothetical protein